MGHLTSGTGSLMMERDRRLSEMMRRSAELAEIFKNATAEHEEECRDLSIEETRDRISIAIQKLMKAGQEQICFAII